MNDLAVISIDAIERMAMAISKSGLFGIKTPEQAVALMLIAQAEGRHPAEAARDYHIIDGRPALKADAMLARYHQAGGKVEWHDYDDRKVSATFSHPQGGTLTVAWTIEMAQTAKLAGRGNWLTYPRQMLRSRVVSEGVRATFPGIAIGTYTPEEVEDMEPRIRDVTPPPEPEPEEPVRITLGATEDLRTACTRLSDTLGLSPERRKEIAKVHQGNLADIKATLEAMLPEAAP